MKLVTILFRDSTEPYEIEAKNEWQEAEFYCILKEDGMVVKWPIRNIWRISVTNQSVAEDIILGMKEAVKYVKRNNYVNEKGDKQ
jgi:hypothetical protein